MHVELSNQVGQSQSDADLCVHFRSACPWIHIYVECAFTVTKLIFQRMARYALKPTNRSLQLSVPTNQMASIWMSYLAWRSYIKWLSQTFACMNLQHMLSIIYERIAASSVEEWLHFYTKVVGHPRRRGLYGICSENTKLRCIFIKVAGEYRASLLLHSSEGEGLMPVGPLMNGSPKFWALILPWIQLI